MKTMVLMGQISPGPVSDGGEVLLFFEGVNFLEEEPLGRVLPIPSWHVWSLGFLFSQKSSGESLKECRIGIRRSSTSEGSGSSRRCNDRSRGRGSTEFRI